MKIEELSTYEIIQEKEISDLNSFGKILKHKKTGANIVLLENDDDNKVFYIGFRTPPTDSTGVAHILEHSVLCGSKEFPVKDPFVELAKGSLNTFLNAMTYPDKTVYPVASCNNKDFQNLMHVYLDAVFYPNIYAEPRIFMQEGWHYHLEQADDALKYNGVVYNEMKGAFSSPDDVLDREIFNSLFPDTTYGYESGGDPKFIPELTYEQFLSFHKRYYHPSNSYLYLYGNMDMAEKLEWIDKNYLSKFDYLEIDSTILQQQTFEEPIDFIKEYSIAQNESEKNATYLSYNTVVGSGVDKELYIAFQILDYALCSAPGAPLKQALIDAGIGEDIYSVYENGILQPYFSIVAKNTEKSQKEEFLNIIQTVLQGQVTKGIDKKALKAGINYYEFKYKEADFGSYPKGLMYGLQALDSWLYNETAPFEHIEANQTFEILKQKIETGFYEELVDKFLIHNPHKAIITVVPVKGLTAQMERELQVKLDAYKASLSEKEINELVEDTQKLLAYQSAEPTAKELERIPLLEREDIRKEAEPFINDVKEKDGIKILSHDIFTNGVSYIKFIFDANQISNELMPYVGILKNVLGFLNTKNYSYGDLFNEINLQTGGFHVSTNTYVNSKKLDEFNLKFEVKIKALYENTEQAFELIKEILLTTKFTDYKRVLEVLKEMKSRMQAYLMSSGHSAAAMRSLAYFSQTAAVQEQLSGIEFYRLLEKIDEDYENQKENVAANLQKALKIICRPENLMIDYTGTEEGLKKAEQFVEAFKNSLFTNDEKGSGFLFDPVQKNEGFKTSAGVQYVAMSGSFLKSGLPYTGALRVLKVIMGYEYLWNNVRVKGGAYGCMSNFTRSGECYFASYRDPNIRKTINTYKNAVEFVKKFSADERTMTKFIIGAVSDMDVPKNPAAKGAQSLAAYLSNISFQEEQKVRDEVLSADANAIRELVKYLETVFSYNCICVVGNESSIEAEKDLFMDVSNLFG